MADSNKKIRIDLEIEAKNLRETIDKIANEITGKTMDFSKAPVGNKDYANMASQFVKNPGVSNPFTGQTVNASAIKETLDKLQQIIRLQESIGRQENKEKREYLSDLSKLSKKEMDERLKMLDKEIKYKEKDGGSDKDLKEERAVLRKERMNQYGEQDSEKLLRQIRNLNVLGMATNTLSNLGRTAGRETNDMTNVITDSIKGGIEGAKWGGMVGSFIPGGTAIGAAIGGVVGGTSAAVTSLAMNAIPKGKELEQADSNLDRIMRFTDVGNVDNANRQNIGLSIIELKNTMATIARQRGFAGDSLESEALAQKRLESGLGLSSQDLRGIVEFQRKDTNKATTDDTVVSFINMLQSKGLLQTGGKDDFSQLPKYLEKIYMINEKQFQITGKTDTAQAMKNLVGFMGIGGSDSVFKSSDLANKAFSGLQNTFANPNNPLQDYFNRQAVMSSGISNPLDMEIAMENVNDPKILNSRIQGILNRSSLVGGDLSDRKSGSRLAAVNQISTALGLSKTLSDKFITDYTDSGGLSDVDAKDMVDRFKKQDLNKRAEEFTGNFAKGEVILSDVTSAAGKEIGKGIAEFILPSQKSVADAVNDLVKYLKRGDNNTKGK